MRPIRFAFVALMLGSLVPIASAPMDWVKPWEAPKDGSPGDPPCTCDDLRQRLDEAEKMRDAYARAYRGERLRFNASLTKFIEKEMGWAENSAKPQGKPDDATASEQERKQARANCKYCAWICDVSIQRVHEGYHSWFKDQYEGVLFTGTILGDLLYVSQANFVKAKELGEIGAHQAEATFLRETLAEMERKGLCKGLSGTPNMDERKLRWKQADDEVRFHMGLPTSGSPLNFESPLAL